MKLYIFRHGQTDANVQGICQGASLDYPLNATGIEQAKILSSELASLKLPIIYSSPQKRAQMTAQIVAEPNLTTIETIYDLHETMFGEGEGMLESDMWDKYSDVFQSQLNPEAPDFLTAKIPNAESVQDNFNRYDRVVEYIKSNCSYDFAGVASHGTFMMTIYYRMFGIKHELKNCEYFVVEI